MRFLQTAESPAIKVDAKAFKLLGFTLPLSFPNSNLNMPLPMFDKA